MRNRTPETPTSPALGIDFEEIRLIATLARTALTAGAGSWADRRLIASLDPAAVLRLTDAIQILTNEVHNPHT
jgi:hypothetical protein